MWDMNTIYAMGGKGSFVKTRNRGVTWTLTNLAGRPGGIPLQRSDVRDAWFIIQNTGIAVGTLGSISRTTNGGNTEVISQYFSSPQQTHFLQLHSSDCHVRETAQAYALCCSNDF